MWPNASFARGDGPSPARQQEMAQPVWPGSEMAMMNGRQRGEDSRQVAAYRRMRRGEEREAPRRGH